MVRILIVALLGFFLWTAIELVTTRYEQRQLFIAIDRANNETKSLETRWRFLELERANITNTAAMDDLLSQKMDMISPAFGDIIYIKEAELPVVQDQSTK